MTAAEFGGHRSGGFVEWDRRFVGLHDPPGDTTAFWDEIERDTLVLKRCDECGTTLHPRRLVCRRCMSMDLGWITASGLGRVYSFTTILRAPHEEWADRVPYNIGVIELSEGPYLFSEILCEPSQLHIGLEVELEVVETPHGRLAKFRPAR